MDNDTATTNELLRDFIVSHELLQGASAARRDATKARRDALASLAAKLPVCNEPVVAPLTTPDGGTRYLSVVPGAPRLAVSEKALLKMADALTPDDFQEVAQNMSDEMVPVREVITTTMLARLQRFGGPKTRLLKRKPKNAREVDLALDTEQMEWVKTCLRDVPALAPLREQTSALATQLREVLPGASDPDFYRPLVVNLNDEQREMVLRARRTVRKPPLTKSTLMDFLEAMQSERLERVVSRGSVDASELCSLCKRIVEALVRAVSEWRAKNSTERIDLTLAAKAIK